MTLERRCMNVVYDAKTLKMTSLQCRSDVICWESLQLTTIGYEKDLAIRGMCTQNSTPNSPMVLC